MSERYRVVDAAPGQHVSGVLVTPAKLVIPVEGQTVTLEELQTAASRADRGGFGVTDEKRARVKARRQAKPNSRVLLVGQWRDIEGHCRVRFLLTGDPKKVRYEFQQGE